MGRVDAVIPVYRPGRDTKLIEALSLLNRQTVSPERIILMNTGEELYTEWAERERIPERFPGLIVRHVSVEDFDHAATRNQGAALSDAPFLLFMTMDAVPADERLVEHLLGAMERDPQCAVAYARQLPASDADEQERFARSFNYPGVSARRTLADVNRLGIRAIFCSDVCALYRREIFDRLGGFAAPAIFNEDMVFAHAALHAGYSICYCADAQIIHSHHYTAAAQLHRSFDLGVSQAMHPEVFSRLRSEGEGRRFVGQTLKRLYETGHTDGIPAYLSVCAARYTGYFLGRHYRRLPRSIVMKLTNQKSFWKRSIST